jgi:hypothetical protein
MCKAEIIVRGEIDAPLTGNFQMGGIQNMNDAPRSKLPALTSLPQAILEQRCQW